ncbi:hypothetical protein DRP53_08045 [candidate division WOR-3 bacterium]|uniref:TonB-dependent receptor n=1 Tax=candidate division WOR-3 bacterium TaxID=2052148 RepID=A0A660SFP8_UNCW3|nr:MAG: hypothetical protein DRP53_08045 [candidate division WOR-3 bacterium]
MGKKGGKMLPIIIFSQILWIDEIVVTATRFPDPILRVPVSVALITAKDFEAEFDLVGGLSNYAGIMGYSYGYGSLSTIGLRGLPSDQTLVLIDGLSVNSIATGVGDISFIPVDLIERVEVVKGPASSIYGGNATGGVINIKLRRDNFIKTGIGNNGFWALHTSGSVGELFHVLGGGTHWDGDRTNDDMSRYFITGGVKFGAIGLDLRYGEKRFGVPGPVPGDIIPEFGDSTASAIGDREFDQRIIPNLQFSFKPLPNVSIANNLYLNYTRIDFRTYYRNYYPSFPALENDYYRMATVGDEVITGVDFPFNNRLSIGLTYDYDTLDCRMVVDNDSTKERVSKLTWQKGNHRIGIFIEDRQTISTVDLFFALRYDRDKRFPARLSPAAGLSILLTDRIRLRTHWGMAYRRPTFNDLYWPNAGNPDLIPETGVGLESGFDLFLPHDFILSVTGFFRKVTDKIAWVPTGSLWSPQNINEARSTGGEMSITGRVYDLINLRLDYTYLNPEQINSEPVYYDTATNTYQLEEKRRPLINTPKHSARLKVSVDLGRVRTGLSHRYISARQNYYLDYSNFPEISYRKKVLSPTGNTNFFLALSSGNFDISFTIINLLDRRDPIQFGNSIDDQDYPRPGRSFRFELSQRI